MSEIRLDGVPYGPRGRRESFRGSYRLRDGVGVSGRGFAMWSLSWRGKVVPRHPLGDGGRFRARKISEKTYEKKKWGVTRLTARDTEWAPSLVPASGVSRVS